MNARKDLVSISFTVAGEKQLDRRLGILRENVKDLRGVWPDIRDDFVKNQKQQFKTEGVHGSGSKWTPLKPGYAAFKEKNYPGQPILRLTDSLYKSLTEIENGDFIYKPGRLGLTLGSKIEYGAYHQTGVAETFLPRRPPIELTKAQKSRWPKLIQEYIFKSWQGFDRVTL